MTESGYYPPGAEFDPSAPYNRSDPPREKFDVYVVQTLSKTATVETDDYEPEEEIDEDGPNFYYNTDNTDWENAYEDNHYTPYQLITMLKRVLEMQLRGEKVSNYLAKRLIEECEGWAVEEESIEKA